MKRVAILPVALLLLLPVVLALAVYQGRTASAAPAWGGNCLSCHGVLVLGAVTVTGEDGLADPDEGQTGAPDRGTLKVFQAYGGQTKTLQVELSGLDTDDRYAVELRRMRFPGVVSNGQLAYTGDCSWPEWGEEATYYTEPFIAHRWGTGPTTFAFEIAIEPHADADYYDLVFAVAGKYKADNGLFCSDEHFYLLILPPHPGDMDCNGQVDFVDINPFVLALTDVDEYHHQYPECNFYNADCNQDGVVNFADINAFVALVGG